MTMADKIVVLHDGIVEQAGAPLELYDRPANLFVAGFIGSPAMNLFRGTIKGGKSPSFETEDGTKLPLAKAPAASDGRPAIYGIRPEHLALGGKMAAQVAVVEPMGGETQVVASLAGQKLVGIFRDRITAKPGERLPLAPMLENVHLFDAASGQRF
jgi:multiple sugar transport system ATP-binding protein